MFFRAAADVVLVLHLAFIVLALLGAALTVWWRWMPAVHVPAAAWGCFLEITGRVCPLTTLENRIRIEAGQSGYGESFVEHYLLDIIYPPGLSSDIQLVLAGTVVMTNVVIYGWLLHRRRRHADRGR